MFRLLNSRLHEVQLEHLLAELWQTTSFGLHSAGLNFTWQPHISSFRFTSRACLSGRRTWTLIIPSPRRHLPFGSSTGGRHNSSKRSKIQCYEQYTEITMYVFWIISYLLAWIVCYSFNKKNSLTLKYLHVVAKEDPWARTVDGRVVHDGSQL